ncbi:histidine kinase [bacterium endosymbiont of Escarpia laminata]|nr:MAG: histidine kinase [bacterium endosymbiont of Escarpia laminata]
MQGWLESLLDTLQPDSADADTKNLQIWNTLRLFLLYRLTLSLSLPFFFFTGTGPGFLGQFAPELFAFVATIYLGLVLASGIFWYWRSPEVEQQVHMMIFIDILAITLLMHASGGLESGLGMLIAISITGGAVMTGGRAALLFASLASLLVIAEQIYAELTGSFPALFTQAGFLGAVFFALALLTHVLSKRARESEELAHHRAHDLENMARLNDYVIQHMQTGVLVIDDQGKILLMNEPAWRLLGMPDAQPGNRLGAASPELAEMLVEWKRTRRCDCPPFRAIPRGKELRPRFNALGRGNLGGVLVFLEDTSRVLLEAQHLKLASLGRLTASIAHEIRNPLGAISHANQLFSESPNLDRADQRLIEIIKVNSGRVNQVIENVLQLSRHKPGERTRFNLHSWFEEIIAELIRNQGFGSDIFSLQIEPQETQIQADPEQLRQIVTNLCNNALQHTQEPAALKVTIVGGRVPELDTPFVDIIDNGPGIPPDVAKQIFEPFYTTHNSGTGLGLYIARELSEGNRIRLEYIPGPTGGSCFRLIFDNPAEEVTQT